MAARDLSTYGWDSFNFHELAERYMSTVPTVFRLVCFLCGCGVADGLIHDFTDTDPDPDAALDDDGGNIELGRAR